MNKYLFLFLLMLWIGDGLSLQSIVTVEDEVITGVSLPDWGTVCVASDVRGGPDEMYDTRYSVFVGRVVRLHDQSRLDGTWVSIGVAQWMPLKNLCWSND